MFRKFTLCSGSLRDKENGEAWAWVEDILVPQNGEAWAWVEDILVPPLFSSFPAPDIHLLVLQSTLDMYSFPNIKPVCLPWVSHSFSFIGSPGENIKIRVMYGHTKMLSFLTLSFNPFLACKLSIFLPSTDGYYIFLNQYVIFELTKNILLTFIN